MLDLPILTSQFGVCATVGIAELTGALFYEEPARLYSDRAPVNAVRRSLLVRTCDLPVLEQDMEVTVHGVVYRLSSWEPEADQLDGQWTRLWFRDS